MSKMFRNLHNELDALHERMNNHSTYHEMRLADVDRIDSDIAELRADTRSNDHAMGMLFERVIELKQRVARLEDCSRKREVSTSRDKCLPDCAGDCPKCTQSLYVSMSCGAKPKDSKLRCVLPAGHTEDHQAADGHSWCQPRLDADRISNNQDTTSTKPRSLDSEQY